MSVPSGAARRAIVECLVTACREAGTTHLFGVPGGGSNLELVGAAEAQGIRFVLVHTDSQGKPDLVEMGRLRFFVIERSGRFAVRMRDLESDLRKQFNVPVCEFEGVGEALARIAGYTYIINAGMTVTATAIDCMSVPPLPSSTLTTSS